MEPERWQQISRIYHAAQDTPAPERAAFVRDACADDPSLRREVESLLSYEDAAARFLEHAPAGVDGMSPGAPDAGAAIPLGARFGSYEVVARLGAGGMGEVYRAHDSKLGRDVAIKILPRQFAADADRRRRLEREARLLATLNHPHIGGIYGLEDHEGVIALVLELVEGDTLADRIARSRPGKPAIKVREALSIAHQIAEALEAAHDKGIVHRDLKPANIKVTPAGTVKVLDFGIAKASAGDPGGASQESATASMAAATGLGVAIGTPAYMSPEQALGQEIDKQTDIWAFGCVLYEMLTGRGIFGGDTPSETVAAVLDRVPEWRALPDATPSGIRRLLQRCLDRDPSLRLHDIADARLEIDDALASPAAGTLAARAAPSRRAIPVAIVALVGGVVIGLVAWASRRPTPRAPETPTRFAIALPASQPLNLFDSGRALAISPDGRLLVYRAGGSITNGSPLMLRAIDQLEARQVPGIGLAFGPFFSPDGQWIGFFEGIASKELKKVSIRGGPAITVCPIVGTPLGASWGDDDTIVFATNDPATGLWQVPASGGEPAVLTKPDASQGESDHVFPSVLAGGRGVLFTIVAHHAEEDAGAEAGARLRAVVTAGTAEPQVAILDWKTGQRKTLVRGGSAAEYVESGHLVYAADGSLRVVGFDPVRLAVRGDPVEVVEAVMTTAGGAAHYAVSRSGTLVYAPGGSGAQQSLVWVDRKGREEPINAQARFYSLPRVSPDGTRVVVTIWDPDADLWIWDLARASRTRLTFSPANDVCPVWTPDSRQVIFSSARGRTTGFDLYSIAADRTGALQRLTTNSLAQRTPTSITPDGTRLLGYERSPDGDHDIFTMSVMDPSKVEALFHTPFGELFAEVSPNGRYVAYQSSESGVADVYVRPFPHADRGVWKVSREGGSSAVWARNGRELLYLDGSTTLIAVPVETSGPTFRAGAPVRVFDAARYSSWFPSRNYDVSPDGQRFLMVKDGPDRDHLIVVERWFEELRARMPPGGS